jgi:hypothetical protein
MDHRSVSKPHPTIVSEQRSIAPGRCLQIDDIACGIGVRVPGELANDLNDLDVIIVELGDLFGAQCSLKRASIELTFTGSMPSSWHPSVGMGSCAPRS